MKNLSEDNLVLSTFEVKCGFKTSPAQALAIQTLSLRVILFL